MEAVKPKKEKTITTLNDIDLPKSIDIHTPTEERKEIFRLIYQLKIKQHPELNQNLIKLIKQKDLPIEELLEQFRIMMQFFKQFQTIVPVVCIYYSSYKQLMLQKSSNSSLFWSCWKCLPLSQLEDYIKTFKLQQIINNVDPKEFYIIIRQLLLKSKNKEAALFCYLFKITDQEFLLKQVLPRLLQGQDLYTNYVHNLLRHNKVLLDAIVQHLDPVAGIRIVQNTGGNIIQYPKLIRHMQYSAFKHNANEYKDWFKCQEIMGFCPLFLQWYATEFMKQPEKTSLLVRNKLAEGDQLVKNPLFEFDEFTCTEQIIGKKNDKKYLKLQDFNIFQKDVYFVDDDESPSFKLMEDTLFTSSIVGFDSQFKAISHKYEQDGVSIIQLSGNKKVFIIDFIKLSSSAKTIDFLRKLFEAKNIAKVGHSLKCDFLYLSKTINIDKQSLNSFIDIAELFKIKYPQQNQSSLSYIVLALNGILLSKYEQRSNWNRRPLRKAQMHYAALDAYVCEVIYEKLNQEVELSALQLQKTEKASGVLLINDGWLSYGSQYSNFMKKPRFIVDNMLKRLSTYLRNLGLDAEYLAVRDFQVAYSISSNEKRIILTKDKHLKYKKNIRVPIYLIQSQQSQDMTKQVVSAFNIKLEEYTLLSRCVKCNNPDLVLVDRDVALSKLNFKHPDSSIKEFWSCIKCEQFYWEGHSYNNSRKRFSTFIQNV